MMELEVYAIDGRGFHFGQHGLGIEETRLWFNSDSLLAAVLARVAELYGPTRAVMLAQALREATPPFAFTSAFPRAGQVCLLPQPLQPASKLTTARGAAGTSGSAAKTLKRVSLLSPAAFRSRLAGASLETLLASQNGRLVQQGAVWVDAADVAHLPPAVAKQGEIWAIEKRPRVTVDRMTAAPTLYHAGRVAFAAGCGLWFGIRWVGDAFRKEVETALVDLGHTGLGGERSSGYGAATVTRAGALTLPDPVIGHTWLPLGRFWPRADEISALRGDSVAYSLVDVGGWIGSPAYRGQRRKTVRMVVEGARLVALPRLTPGHLDDVRPVYAGVDNADLHAIWRGGPIVAVGVAELAP